MCTRFFLLSCLSCDAGVIISYAGLEGITSPGMFVKVPPHMRVAKFYDHVKPAEEVLQ